MLAAANTRGTIVALGDSITDGDGSTPNANQRWPDLLGARLSGTPGSVAAVVNAGIGGNRVLSNSPCFGAGALARLERDVFSQTAARSVIFLEGINDIIHPDYAASHKQYRIAPCVSSTQITADDLIAADLQLVAQVHARGWKIFAGDNPAVPGTSVAWTPAGEAKRQAVNQWLKISGVFEGVIDFASAVAYRTNPAPIAPAKDSGDHIHPNDAGYASMANAIDLAMLRRCLE